MRQLQVFFLSTILLSFGQVEAQASLFRIVEACLQYGNTRVACECAREAHESVVRSALSNEAFEIVMREQEPGGLRKYFTSQQLLQILEINGDAWQHAMAKCKVKLQ